MKAFLSLLDGHDLSKQKWLDAGCGTGVLAHALAAGSCSVTGVDASLEMIQAARKSKSDRNHAPVNDPVFEVVETIERLDFSQSSFDGILCSSVLEYVGDPNKAIVEFYRILRPGGVLLVSVPNKISLLRNIQKIIYMAFKNCCRIHWPAYLAFSKHAYTFKAFSRLLRNNGFTVVSSIRYGPYIPRFISRTGFCSSIIIFLAKKGNF
jgi:2-polyprenyl-6-hydroxyphenyl methylase/3-demethylubiquinone-9 3-methyltransferase